LLVMLATIYVALLLARILVDVLSGFTQIVLVLFSAWLLAFILAPVVATITSRLGWSRGIAIGVVYAATLIGSALLLFYAVSAIGGDMGDLTADYPLTKARIESTLGEWEKTIGGASFDIDLVELYRDVEVTAARLVGSMLGDVPAVTVNVLGALVLVVIISLYLLADSEAIVAKMERVVPTRYADEFEILQRTVSRAFGGFLRAQVILAAIQTGLTIALVLLLDLPYGFLVTASSALAMLVPFFGPPLALIPPIVATAIFEPGWLLVAAPLLLIVQTVLVNYVQPRLMREALGMHPVLVLVGLLVGAQVAGLWGALFGIPVFAVLNVFFNYFVNLRTIEETPAAEVDDVLEEVRQEIPGASPEEVAAIAAERVEDEADEADAEARTDAQPASGDLRAAAGELRAAAGEQRGAAGEIGESAADLRDAVERLRRTAEDEEPA
jgi:predicted PurR-regulated permease PerM